MKLSLKNLDVKGKKVLMRVDFNAPISKEGAIADDTRLKESLPSIRYILDHGGALILMSHLGRPDGKPSPQYSLTPCAKALSQLLHKEVRMAPDCIGKEVEKLANALKPGEVLLLENLRFHPAEEKPSLDKSFAEQLAHLGDLYVNDAFGTAHRAHSSTCEIAAYFPGKAAAGFLMEKEIAAFEKLLLNPKRPFYALIGGAKISTKMGVLRALLSKVDALFIGGGMAYTLFKAEGIPMGTSIVEEEQIPIAKEFIAACKEKKIPLYLPLDTVIADAFSATAEKRTIVSKEGIPDKWMGMDIGPKTIAAWSERLEMSATLFWNGPLGVFELAPFAHGTEAIAHKLSTLNILTIIGGGDSVAAINRFGLSDRFTHLSTGGGASLELIEHGHLPGIDVLSDLAS